MPFWKLAGSDLFLLADPRGKVHWDFIVARAGWTQAGRASTGGILGGGEDSTWWFEAVASIGYFSVPSRGVGTTRSNLAWCGWV